MTNPGAIFAKEFINFTPSDILLLTLITFFSLSGLIYKLKASREAWRTRTSIRKLKNFIQQNTTQEQTLKIELKQLLDLQNATMKEITRLRQKKTDMAKLPEELEKQLEELVQWCRERNITVDINRRIASRQPIRKEKQS